MRHLFILCLICAAQLFLCAEDFDSEYWQRLHWVHHKWERVTSSFSSEARFNQHWSRFYFLRLTERLSYEINSHLEAGVNCSYIHLKPLNQPYFTNHYRLELELNPRFTARNITYTFRNRLEFIKQEREPVISKVVRCRAAAYYPIENGGPWIGIGCSEEIFYHLNDHLFNQSRFIPIELTFSLCDENRFSCFFMLRNFISGQTWQKSAVIGTNFSF